jgi:hypothetical protein
MCNTSPFLFICLALAACTPQALADKPQAEKTAQTARPVRSIEPVETESLRNFDRIISDKMIWDSLNLPAADYTYSWMSGYTEDKTRTYKLSIDRPKAVRENKRVPHMVFENDIIITVAPANTLFTKADYEKAKKEQARNPFTPPFDVSGNWAFMSGKDKTKDGISEVSIYTAMRTKDDCFDVEISFVYRSLSGSAFLEKTEDRNSSWYGPVTKIENQIYTSAENAVSKKYRPLSKKYTKIMTGLFLTQQMQISQDAENEGHPVKI